jgi:hypothetical protein
MINVVLRPFIMSVIIGSYNDSKSLTKFRYLPTSYNVITNQISFVSNIKIMGCKI